MSTPGLSATVSVNLTEKQKKTHRKEKKAPEKVQASLWETKESMPGKEMPVNQEKSRFDDNAIDLKERLPEGEIHLEKQDDISITSD